jgi:hypothetical protein
MIAFCDKPDNNIVSGGETLGFSTFDPPAADKFGCGPQLTNTNKKDNTV